MSNKPTSALFDLEVVEEPIEDLIEAEDLPEKAKRKYLNDIRYLREIGQEPGEYPGISAMQTSAYPNYEYSSNHEKPADTRKWVEAARQIFYLVHNGEDRGRALEKVIAKWDKLERNAFYYWLRFYEEGGHLKYKAGDLDMPTIKTAQMPSFQGPPPSYRPSPNPLQFFDGVKQPGYFMPPGQTFNQIKSPSTHPDILNDVHRNQLALQQQEQQKQTAAQEEERREQIEAMRAKVLSRLDSAEKLFRSQEGHMLASTELQALVNGIHQLKQKVLTVNKRTLSTRLYEDLIVRQANILTKNGFFKGAEALHTVAQGLPAQPEANNPLQMGGVPGDIPGQGPGMTPAKSISNNDPAAVFDPAAQAENPSAVASPTALPLPPPADGMTQSSPTENQAAGQGQAMNPDQPSPGMAAFLKRLEDGPNSFDEEDEEKQPDQKNQISAASLSLGLRFQAALVLERFLTNGFVRTAQIPPEGMVPEAAPQSEPTDDIPEPIPDGDPEVAAGKDFDKVIDAAFQQLTIADVVAKLEDLTKVFKVREIPRQLAVVDMMLDRLGLASFFPELGECVQKSHESNNYVSSRLEDILSQLRGTLQTKNIDLAGDDTPPPSPETLGLQNKLRQNQEAEKNRKKMRKDVANRELEQAAKPPADLEVAEDLGAVPAQMAPAPAPIPAPAPAV